MLTSLTCKLRWVALARTADAAITMPDTFIKRETLSDFKLRIPVIEASDVKRT